MVFGIRKFLSRVTISISIAIGTGLGLFTNIESPKNITNLNNEDNATNQATVQTQPKSNINPQSQNKTQSQPLNTRKINSISKPESLATTPEFSNTLRSETTQATNPIQVLTSSLPEVSFGIQEASAADNAYVNNGIAINANGSGAWGMKHGRPIVSQYKYDPSDPEQRTEDIDIGNGKKLIKTNLGCLNAHNQVIGANINAFPCDRNDPDQQVLNGNKDEIVFASSGLKVNLGERSDIGLKLVSNIAFSAPNTPNKGEEKSIKYESTEYEYWIAVDTRYDLFKGKGETPYIGHSWNSVISRTTIHYTDGSKDVKNWVTETTLAINPETSISINTKFEKELNDKILTKGEDNYTIVRKAKISPLLAEKIKNNPGYAGCSEYSYKKPGKYCSCVDFATRSWKYFTNEDLRPQLLWGNTPIELYDSIKYFNQNGQFIRNSQRLT